MDETIYMLSRIVGAAVWCLAAMLGAVLVVGAVAYCGERLRRFARLGLVLCGLAVCVTLFSVKPPVGDTNGVNRAQAPLRVPRLPSPVEPAADIVRISEITVSTNGVDLVLHRPPTNDLAAVEVVLVGSTNLVTATWEPYTNVVFGAGETNVAVFVDQAQLDAHAVSNACFFAFINAGDSDEDGLANWHERFNLKTDPDYEDSDHDGLRDDWEVAHGFDPRSSADCVLSTRPDGIPDVYVIQHGGNPDASSAAARRPDTTEGLIFAESGVAATGQLTNEQSLAVGACPWPRFSHVDLNGLERAATTDIGAFAYAPVPTSATDDADGDGVSDADEFAMGLDPFSDDTDCDGVSDPVEIAQGTDPGDIRSFLRTILVTVVNADVIENTTNYVAWGATPDWTADDIHDVLTATGEGGGHAFEGLDSAEALFVKAYRDLDRDGVCDSAREPVIVCEAGRWSVSPAFRLAFGDVDGDGVSDAAEFADGTNPNAGTNYCCGISATYTGVFQTTNALTFAALWGTNTVWGPAPVTTNTWTHDFGHRLTTCGERACVHVWDDANHNGVWDKGETGDKYDFKPSGHTTCVTNELAYGHFDRNGNNLPDWWETVTELSAGGQTAKEYEDADGDGLVNLHEFWAGTNPLVPDGSNTLLSVCARSVDDRLVGINLVYGTSRFVDFFHNASNGVFVANTNLWCKDVDLSCVSMWHRVEDDYETRGTRTATAITRRHILFSSHWGSNQYLFCDTNGLIVVRNLEKTATVYGDTKIARLDVPLPSSFMPAKIMPSDFIEYLGAGKYLPTICVNENQQVVVGEIKGLDVETNGFVHYGMVGSTNVVNEARDVIRKTISIGQSSSPVFFLLDNKPVLLLVKHLGYKDALQWNPTWGPSLPFYVERIRQIIDSWEGQGAYPLDVVDFSDFDRIRGR